MPETKGFSFPRDVPLCLSAMADAARWHRAVRRLEPRQIIPEARRRAKNAGPARADFKRLEKRYRAASFYLTRVLSSKAPCLARSLAVYEYALRMGLDAKLVVGAAKDGDLLKGHAWVEIGGEPFMESREALSGQTAMLEG